MALKTTKVTRRSVSPFGTVEEIEVNPFQDLESAFDQAFADFTLNPDKKVLTSISDARSVPVLIKKAALAASNDASYLTDVCAYLLAQKVSFKAKEVWSPLVEAFRHLFEIKTTAFLVTHYDQETCAKMGWGVESKDEVLFSRERDIIVGKFFGPATEAAPGIFSEFVNQWMESPHADRILHFLDFLSGSKNPTLDHYLLFTHPTLQRILRDKAQVRSLYHQVEGIIKKISSPTWAPTLQKNLGL
jgi:hypothetical protein